MFYVRFFVISLELNVLLKGCSIISFLGVVLRHVPLQILDEKAWLQTGAGLKPFPLLILQEKA